MSHIPLQDKAPLDAVADIAEGAAVTYYLSKAAKDGRVVKVGSHAEYAGVAAGQIAIANFVGPIIAKLILLPMWGVSFVFLVIGPAIISMLAFGGNGPHPRPLTWYVAIPFMVIGLYVWTRHIFWRSIKAIFRMLLEHGPAIAYKDGYRGPLGLG